MKKSLSDQPEM